MSCWTRELFLSAMARAVSRSISEAHFDPENSKLKSRAGEKENSVGVVLLLMFVVVGVGVGVVVVEGWWWCWG